ncbi:MAG: tRNA epoxyqueuosine(34) reductase QueG [Candidatus Acidiferrales bacterium]
MVPEKRTSWVVERARVAGFDLCGVAPLGANGFSSAARFDELRQLPEWLARGYAGEMNYLRDPRRSDPCAVLPGARSVIVTAMNYQSEQPLSTEVSAETTDGPPRGWISRYAWGDDYHETILPKLHGLISEMRAEFAEPFDARAYVDTGPIVERVAAKYAGLGWLAKNTCLINQKLGSWLFLGVIITTLDLDPSLAPEELPPADRCGSCTRCIDACPTHAFPEPYVLDASRCISYLTIELRSAIPEEFRPQMGHATIGCDICQDVCPWNRKAPITALAAFQPRMLANESARSSVLSESGESRAEEEAPRPAQYRSLLAPELEWLASLSQEDFSRVFRRSAVKRAKWRGLVRNACVALGNSSISSHSPEFSRIVGLLRRLATSGEPLLAEHARWALDRLCSAANTNLESRSL